jgi:hypothetical protein
MAISTLPPVNGRHALALATIALAPSSCGGGESSPDPEGALLPEGGEAPAAQVTDLPGAVKAAGCELEVTTADSRAHVADIEARVDYATNPPTAGKHFGAAAQDGIYDEPPADTTLVHSHEHGRVVIWFKPGLARKDRAGLRALVEEDDDKMLLVPRANMPFDVAATAWNAEPEPRGVGRLLGCPSFGPAAYDALRTFRDEHRGKGPEAIP